MNKYAFWIGLGLALRLLLIPFSLHPDFRAVNMAGFLIAQKGEVFSFYDYLSRQTRDNHWVNLYTDGLFIYPPVAYLTHAVFNALLFPLYPKNEFFLLLDNIGLLRDQPNFALLMVFLKLPYLLADLACLSLLYSLLKKEHRKTGVLFWLFNPVTLYTSYLMSQFDIFIALFILLSLKFAYQKIPIPASISLGIAGSFKPFVLALAPFLPGNQVKNTFVALLTYVITILPYLGSVGFRQYALFASQADKLLYAKIMISGSQYLPLFIVGLLILFWWRFFNPRSFSVSGWMVMPLLLFFSLSHFHPQWFTWAIPLLTLIFAQNNNSRLPIMMLLLCYILLILSFDNSLHIGLFTNTVLPHPYLYLKQFIDPDLFISIIRGVFAGTCTYLAISKPQDVSSALPIKKN